jgi:hypothetical protein
MMPEPKQMQGTTRVLGRLSVMLCGRSLWQVFPMVGKFQMPEGASKISNLALPQEYARQLWLELVARAKS